MCMCSIWISYVIIVISVFNADFVIGQSNNVPSGARFNITIELNPKDTAIFWLRGGTNLRDARVNTTTGSECRDTSRIVSERFNFYCEDFGGRYILELNSSVADQGIIYTTDASSENFQYEAIDANTSAINYNIQPPELKKIINISCTVTCIPQDASITMHLKQNDGTQYPLDILTLEFENCAAIGFQTITVTSNVTSKFVGEQQKNGHFTIIFTLLVGGNSATRESDPIEIISAIPTTVPTPSDCPVWCQIIIAVVVVVAVIIGGTIYLCYCCGCYCFRNTKGCYFRKKKIPEGPLENVKSDATSVTIGWKPPKDGCCLPVKHYIIERRRDVNEEDWIKVATVEAETFTCVVGNLTVGNSYMVRVFAENCCKGISEPLVSDGAVKIRNKSEVPVWPSGTLRCSEIMSDSVTLEWRTPFDNGGSPLTGYAIEAKDSKLKDWYPVADINAGVNRHVVRNLEQGEEYNFRISATNKVGRSQPVTMDTPVTVKPMVTGTNAIALKKRRPSGNNDPEKNSGAQR